MMLVYLYNIYFFSDLPSICPVANSIFPLKKKLINGGMNLKKKKAMIMASKNILVIDNISLK